jgi:CxxC motif-containing protein (DUF1111 family)
MPGAVGRLGAGLALALGVAVAAPADEPGDPARRSPPRDAAAVAMAQAARTGPDGFAAPEPWEALPGGLTSVAARRAMAFSHPAATLDAPGERAFRAGQALFRKDWRRAEGLGPLFDAASCAGCHVRDGRGGRVLRLVPADADLGAQVQARALPEIPGEPGARVRFVGSAAMLADGTAVALRRPEVVLDGRPAAVSPRVAPAMIGMGLLEAIPAEDILALADPEDRDGDGISGRVSPVGPAGAELPGRFGHRAEAASVAAQVAAALSADMGLATAAHPARAGDCTAAQVACRAAAPGDGAEVDAAAFAALVAYSRTLAVPVRRAVDHGQVLRGKALFHGAGCAACHVPKFVTHAPDEPALGGQLIWPMTDLLLHDMGPGLADAGGAEWRTAPLWGLGLAATVAPGAGFLHDGRARTLLEAILWHGGEAGRARDRVARMGAAERAALLRYLGSL